MQLHDFSPFSNVAFLRFYLLLLKQLNLQIAKLISAKKLLILKQTSICHNTTFRNFCTFFHEFANFHKLYFSIFFYRC